MSLHQVIPQHSLRRRFAFAIFRTLALAAVFASLVGGTPAADPAPPVTDMALARSALTALDGETGLKGVNLVVSVVNGVAVIGGPVPSTAVAKRAEQVVRTVEGIKDVRNTCFVSGGPDPLLRAVAARSGSTLPPRPVMTDLPGVLTNQSPPVSPFPVNMASSPTEPASNERVALRPSVPVPGSASILGAPVGPSGVSAPATVQGPKQGTLTGATAGGVLAAVADLRKTEARFAGLTAELRNGVLLVGGSAPRASDGWDFGQKLRHIPGVSRVAVGAISGK